MIEYEFLDNAFWESEDRTSLKCIRLIKLGEGKGKKKEVLALRNKLVDGSDCPIFKEVVAKFGVARIDQNTEERKEKKEKEEREKRAIHEQRKKTAELEMLFNMKLQAFEIEDGPRIVAGEWFAYIAESADVFDESEVVVRAVNAIGAGPWSSPVYTTPV